MDGRPGSGPELHESEGAVISYGGRTLTQSTTPEPQSKDLNADAFMLWDFFWTLAEYRTRVILMHERKEALGARMDANQGHKDWGPAFHRMTDLAKHIRELQANFLTTERMCQAYWLRLTATQRADEELDTLYGVPASQAAIYGMWNRPLGQSPMPPSTMKLDHIALMFAPTNQVAAYAKETGR